MLANFSERAERIKFTAVDCELSPLSRRISHSCSTSLSEDIAFSIVVFHSEYPRTLLRKPQSQPVSQSPHYTSSQPQNSEVVDYSKGLGTVQVQYNRYKAHPRQEANE